MDTSVICFKSCPVIPLLALRPKGCTRVEAHELTVNSDQIYFMRRRKTQQKWMKTVWKFCELTVIEFLVAVLFHHLWWPKLIVQGLSAVF